MTLGRSCDSVRIAGGMSEPESSAEASSAGSSSSLLQTLQKTFSARPSRSAAEKDFAALCAEVRTSSTLQHRRCPVLSNSLTSSFAFLFIS